MTLSFTLDQVIYHGVLIIAGFNIQSNPTDKVMLEFGVMLSPMLIISQQIGLKLDLVLGFRLKLI